MNHALLLELAFADPLSDDQVVGLLEDYAGKLRQRLDLYGSGALAHEQCDPSGFRRFELGRRGCRHDGGRPVLGTIVPPLLRPAAIRWIGSFADRGRPDASSP